MLRSNKKEVDSSTHHGKWQYLPIMAGGLLGVVIFHILCGLVERVDLNSFGLGRNTYYVTQAVFEDTPVAGVVRCTPTLQESLKTLQSKGHRVALWLGASQIAAINNMNQDDQLAVVHANRRAVERGSKLRYIQVAEGNLNFRDFLEIYKSFSGARAVPDWLIIAVTYDDLREEGIYPDVKRLRHGSEQRTEAGVVANHTFSETKVHDPQKQKKTRMPAGSHVLADTFMERLEHFLINRLEQLWPHYRNRGRLKASTEALWSRSLMWLMIKIMGRPVVRIPVEVARPNLYAMNELLRVAKKDGVKILLYQAPHRPGEAKFYHDRKEYDNFFASLAAQCRRQGLRFVNLMNLVPAEHWGLTNMGLPDVFHFTHFGHQKLGDEIDRILEQEGE